MKTINRFLNNKNQSEIKSAVLNALKEDIGTGDVTADSTVSKGASWQGEFIAKSDGVIAGLEAAELVFISLDPGIKFMPFKDDGDRIKRGTVIAKVSGNGRKILSGERTALNFLQRMSGIATSTRDLADLVKPYGTKILDTRKTVPGLRVFDKWAVYCGGGKNHRFGLYDMGLIKDNHVVAAGGISSSVRLFRSKFPGIPLEVEVTNLKELREALGLNLYRILLDNMSISEMAEAVKITGGRVPLEASGNINRDNIVSVAKTGVNFISSGALTHSVKAMDISLELRSR